MIEMSVNHAINKTLPSFSNGSNLLYATPPKHLRIFCHINCWSILLIHVTVILDTLTTYSWYIFCLQNALAITKGILPSDLSQRCATAMREYVASQLITNAEKPPQQKTLCDMVDCKKPNREPWVKCDVCGRWLHYKCVNIKSASPGGFECPICEAQYGWELCWLQID